MCVCVCVHIHTHTHTSLFATKHKERNSGVHRVGYVLYWYVSALVCARMGIEEAPWRGRRATAVEAACCARRRARSRSRRPPTRSPAACATASHAHTECRYVRGGGGRARGPDERRVKRLQSLRLISEHRLLPLLVGAAHLLCKCDHLRVRVGQREPQQLDARLPCDALLVRRAPLQVQLPRELLQLAPHLLAAPRVLLALRRIDCRCTACRRSSAPLAVSAVLVSELGAPRRTGWRARYCRPRAAACSPRAPAAASGGAPARQSRATRTAPAGAVAPPRARAPASAAGCAPLPTRQPRRRHRPTACCSSGSAAAPAHGAIAPHCLLHCAPCNLCRLTTTFIK